MRRLAVLAFALHALAASRLGADGPLSASPEFEIKAAFLLNFAKFVDWPSEAFSGADGPLFICVLGQDPFGPALDDTLRDERIGGLRLVPARVGSAAAARHCHVLYVSVSEEPRYAAILSTLDTRHVLTVGDSPSFLEAGGHMRFYLKENRVRFAANPDALAYARFQISSKLMRVATIERAPQRSGTP
jgi:hypothetical protein